MLLSAVSVLVVAQSSSEIPEGLMNNPVHSVIVTEWNHVIPNDKGKSMGVADVITTNALLRAQNVSYMWWPPSDASVISYMSFRG
jgi:hypothetical protein